MSRRFSNRSMRIVKFLIGLQFLINQLGILTALNYFKPVAAVSSARNGDDDEDYGLSFGFLGNSFGSALDGFRMSSGGYNRRGAASNNYGGSESQSSSSGGTSWELISFKEGSTKLQVTKMSTEDEDWYREIAVFAQLAYFKSNQLKKDYARSWTDRYDGYTWTDMQDHPDVAVYVKTDLPQDEQAQIVIAWSGTRLGGNAITMAHDVITDFQILTGSATARDGEGKDGTEIGADRMRAAIQLAETVARGHPGAKITLTGHSLGGAIALEVEKHANFGACEVECVAYNPHIATKGVKYLTRPRNTIIYNPMDVTVTSVTSCVTSGKWLGSDVSVTDSRRQFQGQAIRVPVRDPAALPSYTAQEEVPEPAPKKEEQSGWGMFASVMKATGKFIANTATSALEHGRYQHGLCQFLPHELPEDFPRKEDDQEQAKP